MAGVDRAFSMHGVVVTGAGGALMLLLLKEGRLEPPSPHDDMRNSLAESSVMARCGDGVLLRI
jgi:hypothetical protein